MPRVVLLLFLIVTLIGCSRGGFTGGNKLITKRGTFPSPLGTSQLVVGSKSASLVDYKIADDTTRKEYRPAMLFSDVMRWAAFWENDHTLWVHSNDIGLSVWKRGSTGEFSQEWLGEESKLIPSIPPEIWDFLASSSKRQWEPFRKQSDEQRGPDVGEKNGYALTFTDENGVALAEAKFIASEFTARVHAPFKVKAQIRHLDHTSTTKNAEWLKRLLKSGKEVEIEISTTSYKTNGGEVIATTLIEFNLGAADANISATYRDHPQVAERSWTYGIYSGGFEGGSVIFDRVQLPDSNIEAER